MGPVLGILAVLAVAGGIVYLAWWVEKKRREGMQRAATAMGFSYLEEDPGILAVPLPLMNRGHSRKARHVLTGELAGYPVRVMDYSYVIGGGKNRTTHRQTVALFPKGGEGLPSFELAPENFLHKLGQVFGYQDIDFPQNEDFSRQYLLRGGNEEEIRRVFSGETLAFLAGKPGWSVQVGGASMALFRARRAAKPEEIPAFLADALTIMNGLLRR
jgi:hypothetical protein